MRIKIWVCPTEGCGNYFGSSSTGDLNVPAPPRTEDRAPIAKEMGRPYRHTRANCPDCRRRGVDAERVPTTLNIEVPAATPVAA